MNFKAFFLFCLISGIFLILSTLITYDPSKIRPRFETQQEIEFTKKMENLFMNGSVTAEGWARHAIWRYVRNNVHANSFRIKEWDYYATYIGKTMGLPDNERSRVRWLVLCFRQ